MSQKRIELSELAEINILPSGEKLSELTLLLCPINFNLSSPVCTFHRKMQLFGEPEPDANVALSGEKQSEVTSNSL